MRLRDEVLDQLSAAVPLDAVVLGLHGAMIADGCVDCECELKEGARRTVGTSTQVGVTFDPHGHLSARRVSNADIISVFKEFPHTDFVETGGACVDLTLRAAQGEITPILSVFDVRMIEVLPTSRAPMRGFVDNIVASTNHFHGAFAPIASEILYVAVEGPYPSDPCTNHYTRMTRAIWPISERPHQIEEAT